MKKTLYILIGFIKEVFHFRQSRKIRLLDYSILSLIIIVWLLNHFGAIEEMINSIIGFRLSTRFLIVMFFSWILFSGYFDRWIMREKVGVEEKPTNQDSDFNMH